MEGRKGWTGVREGKARRSSDGVIGKPSEMGERGLGP